MYLVVAKAAATASANSLLDAPADTAYTDRHSPKLKPTQKCMRRKEPPTCRIQAVQATVAMLLGVQPI